MRSFLIAMALATICGCANTAKTRPYFDLRHPVYVVAEKSFWLGCEGKTSADKDCREVRIKEINDGFNQWFDYFPKANRPKAIFVLKKKSLPKHPVNHVIHLGISNDYCGDADIIETIVPKPAGACYDWGTEDLITRNIVKIVFRNITQLFARNMAHEFGHALGRGHRDLPRGKGSVMSYHNKTDVTPLDIKIMCKMHRECRMVKRKHRK